MVVSWTPIPFICSRFVFKSSPAANSERRPAPAPPSHWVPPLSWRALSPGRNTRRSSARTRAARGAPASPGTPRGRASPTPPPVPPPLPPRPHHFPPGTTAATSVTAGAAVATSTPYDPPDSLCLFLMRNDYAVISRGEEFLLLDRGGLLAYNTHVLQVRCYCI